MDGIALDWLRHPFFFRPAEERRNLLVMNDFVRHIRRRLEYHGKKRGRPILLAVRVPDTPERALAIGLDVQTWVSSGWVDILEQGR